MVSSFHEFEQNDSSDECESNDDYSLQCSGRYHSSTLCSAVDSTTAQPSAGEWTVPLLYFSSAVDGATAQQFSAPVICKHWSSETANTMIIMTVVDEITHLSTEASLSPYLAAAV